LSQILLIIFFAVLGFIGGNVGAEYIGEIDLLDIIYTILIIGVSFPLHVILHEMGHVLGGLASGYEFIMFRLFNTIWIKTDDGLSKRKEYVPGVMGQALMVPPETKNNEQPPFLLYHSSGVLMNLLTAILFILLGQMTAVGWLAYFHYVSAAVALFLMITNALPLQGTDGYNIRKQFKEPHANTEITTILYMYRDMVQGVPLKDLQQYVDLDSIDSLKNPNAATFYTLKADYFLAEKDFKGAHQIYEMLWNNIHDLFPAHQPNITLNYLFTLLLTNPTHANVEKITQGKIYQKYKDIKQSEYVRVYAAKALYVDEDSKKTEKLLDKGEEYITLAPTVTEEKLEEDLYQFLRDELRQRF